MALSNKDYKTWCNYYDDKMEEPGTLQLIGQKPLSFYDTESLAYASNPNSFLLSVAGSEYYFTILAGSLTTIKILHYCITVAPEPGEETITIGIRGNRRGTSQFKEVKARAMTQTMTVPPSTRGVARLIPTLKQMLCIADADEFAALQGDDVSGKEIDTLKLRPISFRIHPAIFTVLEGAKGCGRGIHTCQVGQIRR
jgi:hypothetical protein